MLLCCVAQLLYVPEHTTDTVSGTATESHKWFDTRRKGGVVFLFSYHRAYILQCFPLKFVFHSRIKLYEQKLKTIETAHFRRSIAQACALNGALFDSF